MWRDIARALAYIVPVSLLYVLIGIWIFKHLRIFLAELGFPGASATVLAFLVPLAILALLIWAACYLFGIGFHAER